MSDAAPAPLILTLGLDRATFAIVERLRRDHFPPERNVIPAHLTLFHHLPGAQAGAIVATLGDVVRDTPAFDLTVTGPRFLGKGVALDVTAPPLVRLRADLASRWAAWLGRQDAQPYRPHVTVQNKVDSPTARSLYERLRRDWEPVDGRGEALLLWRYMGGPWEPIDGFRFAGVPALNSAPTR